MNNRIASAVLAAVVLAASVSALQTIRDDLRISKRATGSLGGSLAVDSSITVGKRPTSTNLHTIAGWDSGNDTLKQATTVPYSDTSDVSRKALLTTHGVTPGTVPKAATDSTFEDSHISENGDTTKITHVVTSGDTVTVYTDSSYYENSGALAYGGGTYVNMGWGARDFRTSTDGITWTDSYDADVSYPYFTGMCYGLGTFVAVSDGENGYDGVRKTATSSDGLSWSSQTSINNNHWQSVTFGGDTFVAVSSTGSGNRVMTSVNGVDWTSRSSASDDDWYGVAYGEGVFVAVSRSGTYGSMVSSNGGITWATGSLQAYYWHDIIYGNGQFVAVADDSCAISNDGYSWTGVTLPEINESVTGVAYGDGRIVIVYGNDDGMETYSFAWSTDGLEWNPVVVSPNRYWKEIVYDGSRFVAVENVPDHSMIIDFDGQPDTPTVFLVSGGNSNFVGKVAIENTPTTTTGARVMIKNPDPDNEIKQVTVENLMHAMGKVDSAAVADSADYAPPSVHGVSNGYIPHAVGTTSFNDSALFWGNWSYKTGPSLWLGTSSLTNPELHVYNNSTSIGSSASIFLQNGITTWGYNNSGGLNLIWLYDTAGAGYSKFITRTVRDQSPPTYIDHIAIKERSGQLILNDTIGGSDARGWLPVLIKNGGLDVNGLVQIDSTPDRSLNVVLGKSSATGDTIVSRSVDSLDVDSARAAGTVDGFSVNDSTVVSTSYVTVPDNVTLKRMSMSNLAHSLGMVDSAATIAGIDSIRIYDGANDSLFIYKAAKTWFVPLVEK